MRLVLLPSFYTEYSERFLRSKQLQSQPAGGSSTFSGDESKHKIKKIFAHVRPKHTMLHKSTQICK